MILTSNESKTLFAIMRDLSCDFSHKQVRQRIGKNLLDLLNADYFASYHWNPDTENFEEGIQINMCPENLNNYEAYFQYHDPITPILQNRRKATAVSHVMEHERLRKTEFFNDFLLKDGLCYGMNYFAYDRELNIGDIRIWRNAQKNDFSEKDIQILDAIGPSFSNALARSIQHGVTSRVLSFSQLYDTIGITNREAQIADLIMSGKSDQEICNVLNIAKPTLRTHIRAVFAKTGISRRTQISPFLMSQQQVH